MNRTEEKLKYRLKPIEGGIYMIKNKTKNKILLKTTTDLKGAKNRFDFSKSLGSCLDLTLQKDWQEQHSEGFIFEVLEELKQGETQSEAEYKKALEVLKTFWQVKLSGSEFY